MKRKARPLATAAVVVASLALVGWSPSNEAPAPAAPSTEVASPAKNLASLFGPGSPVIGRSFVIGGLGSSVGAGATLTNPADTPVEHFRSTLERRVVGANLARWTTVNGSVPGSTIHDGASRDWAVLRRAHPDVVVLAYGMNDGAIAQFNTGETYGGAMADFRALLLDVRADGAVPVVLTSPSPHTERINWNYPEGPRAPQQSPVDTSAPVRTVALPGGGSAVEATRHAAVNEGMREIAGSLGVDVIDVEPFWLRAVADRGQDALFNAGEFVHPNLLGHRLSYHAATDAWFARGPWAAVSAGPVTQG